MRASADGARTAVQANGPRHPVPAGVALPRETALDVARALAPAFPVPSAGIKASAVPDIVKDFGTDVVVNAGTAVFGHPDGPVAGAESFVRAIDAAVRA